MPVKNLLLISILFFVSLKIAAQDLSSHFHHVNTTNGLSSDAGRCLFKDHNGFLWIGTHSGLNRFDGKNVLTFIHQPNDSTSLLNDDILSICEDASGKIWIVNNNGVSVLNPFTNKFTNYTTAKKDTATIPLAENAMAVSFFKNKIYIITHNGIICTSADTVSMVFLSDEKNLNTKNKFLRGMPNLSYATSHGLFVSTFDGMFFSQDRKNFYNNDLKLSKSCYTP